jgi:hypothetical protein
MMCYQNRTSPSAIDILKSRGRFPSCLKRLAGPQYKRVNPGDAIILLKRPADAGCFLVKTDESQSNEPKTVSRLLMWWTVPAPGNEVP